MSLTKSDLQEISKIVKTELIPVKKDLTDIKKRVKKTEINVESMLGFLDKQDVELYKRVEKIEKHLNLPSKN